MVQTAALSQEAPAAALD